MHMCVCDVGEHQCIYACVHLCGCGGVWVGGVVVSVCGVVGVCVGVCVCVCWCVCVCSTVLKDLVLIPVHTKPDDSLKELDELYEVCVCLVNLMSRCFCF